MYSMFVEQGYEPPTKKSCPSVENSPLDCTKTENNGGTDLRILQVMYLHASLNRTRNDHLY